MGLMEGGAGWGGGLIGLLRFGVGAGDDVFPRRLPTPPAGTIVVVVTGNERGMRDGEREGGGGGEKRKEADSPSRWNVSRS